MDYNDVVNMSEIANNADKITPEQSRRDISHEVVFFICCTVAFVADVAIIFTIMRFKQMRNVRNILIVNWAVMDICTLVVTPSGYRLLSVFSHVSISRHTLSVLTGLGAAFHYMVIICVFALLADWCIAAYFHNASRKIRAYYKISLAIIWGILILVALQYIYIHRNGWYGLFLHAFIGFVTLCALALFILILRIIIAIQKCKKKPLEYPKLALHLATGFIMCYVLALANAVLVDFIRLTRYPIFVYLSACMIFCNGILNFVLLYFCDTHFQAHFMQVLKCNFQRYNNQLAELDDHFSEISFHSPTQQLINSEH